MGYLSKMKYCERTVRINIYIYIHTPQATNRYHVPCLAIPSPIPVANVAREERLLICIRTRPDFSYLIFTIPARNICWP